MKRFLTAAAIIVALAMSAFAQDWYHEREERFRGEQWRAHVFMHVKTDLEHVWSGRASDKERTRIEKTEQELTKMQADLDQGRWDNGILNDVIDSIRKSANDDRLPQRDREVLADDLVRLKDFQDRHNHR
jgi:opacity protein-like surface antigen